MTKKRIDFYCGTFLTGGIETTLIQIFKHISTDVFKIRLIILYKTVDSELLLDQIPHSVEIKYIVGSNLLNSLRSKRLKQRLPLFLKIIEEVVLVNVRRILFAFNIQKTLKQADVIVDYGMCLMKYKHLLTDKKTIIYNHFSLNHINRHNYVKNLKRIHELNNYSKVITICKEMEQQFITHFPDDQDKVQTIYNYVDFNNINDKANAPNPLEKPEKYIIAIGRLDETQKDYTTLIKAFAICKHQNAIEEKLLILGKGRDLEKLQMLCKTLNITNEVIFQGFDTNPYKWIKKAELLVHSSKFEGLPTVIIEAHLLQKPVIATNCETGVKELLDGGNAGMLCKVGDSEELAIAITKMLTNKQYASLCVSNGQELLSKFKKESTIGILEKLLQTI